MTTETQSPSEIASAAREAARKQAQRDKAAKKKPAKPTQAKPAPVKKAAKAVKPSAAPSVPEKSTAPAKANRQSATLEIATELDAAFNHFNRVLFDDHLMKPVITLTRLRKYQGMFAPGRWSEAGSQDATQHEIQLDAVVLREVGDEEALSTLVHEMAHLAVFMSGKGPKKGGYHCKLWAKLMNELGLTPIAVVKGVKQPGKETGANCTHEIVKGGEFSVAAAALMATGFSFSWHGVAEPVKVKGEKKKKAGAKVAYECPKCAAKAWGKPDLKLMCATDKKVMVCAEPSDESDEGEGDDD